MRKIVVALGYILLSPLSVFAFQGEIHSDVESVEVGKGFQLHIEIESESSQEINVGKIVGIENFDLAGSSYAQRYAQHSVVVNGEVQRELTSQKTLSLFLYPKNTGTFSLGPIELTSGDEVKNTNTINIEVVGKGVNLQKSTKDIAQKQSLTQQQKSTYVQPKKDNFYLYIIGIIGVFFILLFLIMQLKKSPQPDENIQDDTIKKEKDTENTKQGEALRLPNIDDSDFYEQLEKYIKPYKDNEKYKKILETIQQGKYSNQLINKGDLLDEVRAFIP